MNINIQSIIKIFVWLRYMECSSLDGIKICRMNEAQTVFAFVSYWITDTSNDSHCLDVSKIDTDGKIGPDKEYNLQCEGKPSGGDWEALKALEKPFGYICHAGPDEPITEDSIEFVGEKAWW